MRFEIRGVRAESNEPVHLELEAADAASITRQVAQMGLVNVEIRQIAAVPPAFVPPVGGGGGVAVPPPVPPVLARGASSAALRLWLAIGIPVAVVIIAAVVVLIIMLKPGGHGAVGGGAQGAQLDPRRYLPELGAKDSFLVGSMNVQSLLAQQAVKDLRAETPFDKNWEKSSLSIKPEDIQEMLLVFGGNFEDSAPPDGGVVIRLKQDMKIEEISKTPLGASRGVHGFTVYDAPREFSRAVMAVPALAMGSGPVETPRAATVGVMLAQYTAEAPAVPAAPFERRQARVFKIGPATYMLTSPLTDTRVDGYLKTLAVDRPAAYPAGIAETVGRAGKGDIVAFGELKVDTSGAAFPVPRQFAAALSVRSTFTLTAAGNFKDEDSAKRLVAFYTDHKEKFDAMPAKIETPVQSRTFVTLRATGELREIVNAARKGRLPLPF